MLRTKKIIKIGHFFTELFKKNKSGPVGVRRRRGA